MFPVLLRRLSLSAGFLSLDDLRKYPFGEDGSRPLSGADGSLPPSEADGSEEAPFAMEGRGPRGLCMVRGDQKEAVGPSVEGGK
jgi:hypothetical protein